MSVAPVKGLALERRDEIELEPFGVRDNRRFYIVDEGGRRYGLLRDARLWLVVPTWDEARNALSLVFPDGRRVEGEVVLDGRVTTDFYGRPVTGHFVAGSFGDALSDYAGRALRLVKADRPGAAVDRGRGSVTIVSEASLAELARHAGREAVDARRFRMLVGVEGCAPHAEDEWLGGRVRLGEAVVELYEQVARCAITTQNPDTGARDLDTLRTIRDYRGLRDGEALDFGVFGDVVEPGRVSVGDAVEPLQ